MSNLQDFVLRHVYCKDDTPPDNWDVVKLFERHDVDMYFFKVSLKSDLPSVEEFVQLTKDHISHYDVSSPLEPTEHSYIEVGAWIGDQALGMLYMALGSMLGLWKIMHPGMILNINNPEEKVLADRMAGAGYVSIIPNPKN